MNPRRGHGPQLHWLLTVLIALGPWTLVSGNAGDHACCGTAIESYAIAGKSCCNAHEDQKLFATCSGHGCPAAHCAPVSFLPSVTAVLLAPVLVSGMAAAREFDASHLGAPHTPPPIVSVRS